jgi:hypothetical protein
MAYCSYCGKDTSNPCRNDEEARRCKPLRRSNTLKVLLTLMLMLLSGVVFSQTSYAYQYSWDPTTPKSTKKVETTVTVAKDHSVITIMDAQSIATYDVARVMMDKYDGYVYYTRNGLRVHVTCDFAYYSKVDSYIERVYSNIWVDVR